MAEFTPDGIEKGGSYANVVLSILGLIYVQNQWSRYSFNYLYAVSYDDDDDADYISILAATDLSYAQYGILTGFGFSATFCVTGLFMGRAADVYNRKNIIACGAIIWNAALFGIGMSNSFMQLLFFRLLLGAGQAFSNPASYSLIAEYFPNEELAQANGLFACGVYIGGGLASLCIDMADALGWRKTCFLIALIGGGLAVLEVIVVREPSRVQKQVEESGPAAPKQSMGEALSIIFGSPLICIIFAASSLRFMGGYAIASYLPTFYDVVFASYQNQYSFINAYVVAAGGFISSWGGGIVSDRWLKTEPKARFYLPALGCFLGIPFICICCLSSNFYVSILLGLFCEYLVAECWFGPVVAVMQGNLPPTCRALAISCFTLIATFFGSLASYLIGVVYDLMLDRGYESSVIRWIVLWSVVASYGSSGYLFLVASRFAPSADSKPLLSDPEKADSN